MLFIKEHSTKIYICTSMYRNLRFLLHICCSCQASILQMFANMPVVSWTTIYHR